MMKNVTDVSDNNFTETLSRNNTNILPQGSEITEMLLKCRRNI